MSIFWCILKENQGFSNKFGLVFGLLPVHKTEKWKKTGPCRRAVCPPSVLGAPPTYILLIHFWAYTLLMRFSYTAEGCTYATWWNRLPNNYNNDNNNKCTTVISIINNIIITIIINSTIWLWLRKTTPNKAALPCSPLVGSGSIGESKEPEDGHHVPPDPVPRTGTVQGADKSGRAGSTPAPEIFPSLTSDSPKQGHFWQLFGYL